MPEKVNKYTVILSYPDYMTSGYPEYYVSHESGVGLRPAGAEQSSREQVVASNDMNPDQMDDFNVVATFDGHLIDRSGSL